MTTILDVVGTGVAITGGGLVATLTGSSAGARTSFGRNTGKWLVRGTVLAGGFSGLTCFGFMSAGGAVTGPIPGNSGSPVGTGFSLGPQGKFVGSDAFYRIYNQTNVVYVLHYPAILTIAINLDTKRYWWNASDGVTSTGWQYDDGGATPVADPTLSVGTDYSAMITGSGTLYPFVYLGASGDSGSIDFSPVSQPTAQGFSSWVEPAPTGGGWIDPKVVRALNLSRKAYYKAVEDERSARKAGHEAMFATIERTYDKIMGDGKDS